MIAKYKLPIQGKALRREPLKGDPSDPICIIDLYSMAGFPTVFDELTNLEKKESYSYQCLDYNIDEEWAEVELEASEQFHQWLSQLLNQYTKDELYEIAKCPRLKGSLEGNALEKK